MTRRSQVRPLLARVAPVTEEAAKLAAWLPEGSTVFVDAEGIPVLMALYTPLQVSRIALSEGSASAVEEGDAGLVLVESGSGEVE